MKLVAAKYGDFGRIGKCIFQPVGKPIGHGVAHHHDRAGGRHRLGFRIRLARAWRARAVDLHLRLALVVAAVGRPKKTSEKTTGTLAKVWIAVVAELRLSRRREDDLDGAKAGHGQNDRSDDPARKPFFANHADRPSLF